MSSRSALALTSYPRQTLSRQHSADNVGLWQLYHLHSTLYTLHFSLGVLKDEALASVSLPSTPRSPTSLGVWANYPLPGRKDRSSLQATIDVIDQLPVLGHAPHAMGRSGILVHAALRPLKLRVHYAHLGSCLALPKLVSTGCPSTVILKQRLLPACLPQ